MEFKPTKPNNIDQYASGANQARGCGCLGIGCLVSVLLLVVLCVGSYITMMHTSFPLAMIEWAIEEDGTARVEGLRGSIASGFEIDRLEFLAEDGKHWNEFRGIKFAFNGMVDLMSQERFVVEEASVREATIYSEYGESDFQDAEPEIDFNWFVDDVEFVGDEFREAIDELQQELQEEGIRDLKEIRIDLVNIQNIDIVDPKTDQRLKIEQVEFRDFRIANGELDSLGQISVKSDFVEIDTTPSVTWPDEKLAWRLAGALKTNVHPLMIAPVPLEMEVALFDDDRSATTASLFDGAIRVSDPNSKLMTINVSDFSPGEFFDLGTSIVPTKWTLDITSERPEPPVDKQDPSPGEETEVDGDDTSAEEIRDEKSEVEPEPDPESGDKTSLKPIKRVVSILPGGHFDLGKTQFEVDPASFDVISNDEPPLALTATGMIGNQTVSAKLRSQPRAPFVFVELSMEGKEPRDIWAQLFFEMTYDELEDEAKASIDKVLVPAKEETIEL